MDISSTKIRVRYSETDKMGPAHHSNYINWMEIGRTEFLRKNGYDYKKMENDGYLLPVVELECKYLAPAEYDDLIEIKCYIEEMRKRTIKMVCEIYRENDNVLLAKGHTVHPCIDKTNNKIISFPLSFINKFK